MVLDSNGTVFMLESHFYSVKGATVIVLKSNNFGVQM
jgi:hypothetical protein